MGRQPVPPIATPHVFGVLDEEFDEGTEIFVCQVVAIRDHMWNAQRVNPIQALVEDANVQTSRWCGFPLIEWRQVCVAGCCMSSGPPAR